MTDPRRLDGVRVLLIAPAFFGYEVEIQKELEQRGAIVDRLLDRPFKSALMKAAARFRRAWVLPAADSYYAKALDALAGVEHEIVLVVSGQTLSEKMIRRIASERPTAQMILYMWDSLGNRPAAAKTFSLFHRVLSFDRRDAQSHGLRFRPLFYGSGFEVDPDSDPSLAFSFIGTAHTDRYAVVKAIADRAPQDAKSFQFYFLHAPWVFLAQKLINPAFRSARFKDFAFEALPKAKVWEVFRQSNVIIDVEHPKQSGLTMRTIEAFGAGKKLITTNADVQTYDLYDPANIVVIDRANPQVPNEFFATKPTPAPSGLRHKYSIAGWLDEVLGRTTSDTSIPVRDAP